MGHIKVFCTVKILNWNYLNWICLIFKYVLGMPDRLGILLG